MAKTRMKTTPTRLQKDALSAEKIKTGLRHVNSTIAKEPLHVTSTVVVPAPKRANSISSATSSISHTSDAHSVHSENDFVSTAPLDAAKKIITTTSTTPTIILPQSPVQLNSIKLKNNLNSKPTNAAALKNRKIFMITEKCDDMKSETSNANNCASITGQKRKMYLIMEDEQQQEQQQYPTNGLTKHSDQEKCIKNETTGGSASKKLTLFTDKCDAQLTQKFEKILPEILSRINSKVKDQATKIASASATATAATTAAMKQIGHTVTSSRLALQVQLPHVKHHSNDDTEKLLEPLENVRLPITLPPKKNRMKIINTAPNSSSSPTTITSTSAQRSISAATPVIVANSNLVTVAAAAAPQIITKCSNGNTDSIKKMPQKNINLSTDFLFLMKMLPKLERIPEPLKSHVKSCIEKIVSQNSTLLNE